MRKAWIAWSSGKDSAWALYEAQKSGEYEIVGALTTVTETFGRVAMHAVREEILKRQCEAMGLPQKIVPIPFPCPNEIHEARMDAALKEARAEGVTHIIFGDLFLEDIRAYRVRQLAGTGIEPLFPIWCSDAETPALARRIVGAGVRAVLTCVDPRQLSDAFVGRAYDADLLADLPPAVDPCGERGEFHTFCWAGPMFARDVPVLVGERVTRDGFAFADLLPA